MEKAKTQAERDIHEYSLKELHFKNQKIRFDEFVEDFADKYIDKHSKVAKTVSEDYKQRAINQALAELYCNEGKYGSEKNK